MSELIVRTYWRDNANPFPGRLIDVKRVIPEKRRRSAREVEEIPVDFGDRPDADNPAVETSDGGKAAEDIRNSCEATPAWRTLWARARRQLTRKQKRILDALLVDFRTTSAAKRAGVERSAVLRFKKTFFKMHFDQCHTAWKRYFG